MCHQHQGKRKMNRVILSSVLLLAILAYSSAAPVQQSFLLSPSSDAPKLQDVQQAVQSTEDPDEEFLKQFGEKYTGIPSNDGPVTGGTRIYTAVFETFAPEI
ncbi:Peptidase S41 [Caenorhabditis elegans]|uniref:Peptidase S41 n=1 Tax=Caenorhabditis elegans TaxID=6239 RepID=A0A0K3ASD7_CAEEL|nr:Peptidase S41 [Caenorhabditis elegans]CTQ86921.1 Peptidase S41 [Caenorhabditis elegans]|eukprot:NP_001300222.1 Uncharacterized protein CELE_Y32G9A.2 [Caenorhabditis elegans]